MFLCGILKKTRLAAESSQKPEAEAGSQKPEAEVRSQKRRSEVRSGGRKPEAGSQKLKIRSQKPQNRGQIIKPSKPIPLPPAGWPPAQPENSLRHIPMV